MTFAPRSGFDWTRVRWSGPLAPVDETCSYCGAAIPDEDVPLRLWNETSWAAVFCYACMETWWGMQRLEDHADDPFIGSEADRAEQAFGDDYEPVEDFEDDDGTTGEAVDHGLCCVCETHVGVRNVIMLDKKAPMTGRGWGCVVCDLPTDGAIAIVCDTCVDQPLKFACRGYPGMDGRVAISELTGTHVHDLTRHSEGD